MFTRFVYEISRNNSTTRTFILPDTTETGIDLKDKTFSILAENSNKQQWKTVVDKNDVEILDNYIKIKWNIGSNETAVSGILKISIEAVGDNFTWQTYSANFNVKQSLTPPFKSIKVSNFILFDFITSFTISSLKSYLSKYSTHIKPIIFPLVSFNAIP